jgi:hypothetical protein
MWKCAVKPVRGFYSVVKQKHIRLHNQVWPATHHSTSEDAVMTCALWYKYLKINIQFNLMRIMLYYITSKLGCGWYVSVWSNDNFSAHSTSVHLLWLSF